MKSLQIVALGLGLLGSMAGSAFAQGESIGAGDFNQATMRMITPAGKVSTMQVTDKAMAQMLIKEATPLAGNVMLFMYEGKMYLIADKKMPDGRMLSEMFNFSAIR